MPHLVSESFVISSASSFSFPLLLSLVVLLLGVARADAASLQPLETAVVPGTERVELGDPDSPCFCLLVHGFAGSRKDFANLGELLARAGCRVRLDRLPGHGTSPEDMERTTPDDLVRHVEEQMKRARQEYEKVILVGFSMGGAISTIVAAREPPDRLVLIAPCYAVTPQWFYFSSPEAWNRRVSSFVRWIPKSQATIQVNRKAARPALYSYGRIPTSAVNTLSELGERARQPELLGSITMPVLMLHSPSDFAASQEASEQAFASLGSEDKRYVRVNERNNHHLLHDWDRDQVKSEIMAFLQADLPSKP